MKKKGFTLIELLAVILILGVIALIAIPTVNNIVEESKRSSFKSGINNVVKSIEQQCQIEQIRGEELTTSYVFTENGVDNELNIKGKLPTNGNVTVDSSCNTVVSLSDGNFCAKKALNSEEIKIGQIEDGKCIIEGEYLCKRATTLHKETCSWDSASVLAFFNQTYGPILGTTLTEDIFQKMFKVSTTEYLEKELCSTGEIITFGNEETKKEKIISGDAFDCDVNGDGLYDSETERFYYVSDYYNTSTKEYETDKAVLIYYSNTKNGLPDSSSTNTAAYNLENYNYVGPTGLVKNLPTVSQWSNVSLINNKRAIITETGAAATTGGNLPTAFDYSKYSARLLTAQEINAGCGITVKFGNPDELANCNYLVENTQFYVPSKSYSYWIENPYSESSDGIWSAEGQMRLVWYTSANIDHVMGVRPAIEVFKTDILY